MGLFRTLNKWLLRKGYRATPLVTGESDVIKKTAARKRNRRLDPDEESKLLSAAGPHLRRVIIGALETGCRIGEILSLQWVRVSLARREILLPARKTKTRTDRVIPISARLLAVLQMVHNDTDGEPFGPDAFVFGDETGGHIKDVKRAWQTAVLKAHGCEPEWAWKKAKPERGLAN